MPITLAFDVYGTLIDTSGVNDLLKQYIKDKTEVFMDL
jgi:2-haloacid dehalogenase